MNKNSGDYSGHIPAVDKLSVYSRRWMIDWLGFCQSSLQVQTTPPPPYRQSKSNYYILQLLVYIISVIFFIDNMETNI